MENDKKEKIELTKQEKEELLKVAESLEGYKKIKAYHLAGLSDTASKYADEWLREKNSNEEEPWYPPNWKILEKKHKLDKDRISYNPDLIKSGLINTDFRADSMHPTKEEIKTIDDVFATFDIDYKERGKFFKNYIKKFEEDSLVYTTKDKEHIDWGKFNFFDTEETVRQGETGYSNLAERIGISRKNIVTQYLNELFDQNLNDMCDLLGGDFGKKVLKFVKKENVPDEQILGLADKVMNNYKGKNKPSLSFYFLSELSKFLKDGLPSELVIKTLKTHVENGGMLYEMDKIERGEKVFYEEIKHYAEMPELREKSLRNKIEENIYCEEEIEYGIKEFGLNPQEGWLRDILENRIAERKNKFDEDSIEYALNFGKKYDLLPKEEIAALKRKLKVVKMLE